MIGVQLQPTSLRISLLVLSTRIGSGGNTLHCVAERDVREGEAARKRA